MKSGIFEWAIAGMSPPGQWFGLVLSFAFIFAFIGVAQLLLHRKAVGPGATRKIVHIGVAHWWIIAMIFIDDLAVALIGPLSFVLINYISYRRHIFAAMEHPEPRKNLGTIYFPVALVFLVLLTWSGLFPRWYGLVATLVLGWGDGSAALAGERFGDSFAAGGSSRFSVPGGRKSAAGTTAMFLFSFAVTVVVLAVVVAFPSVEPNAVATGPQLLQGWFTRFSGAIAENSWVARPSDNVILVALSRLDGVVRLVVDRVSEGTLGTAVSWEMEPTTMVAVAFVVAAAATAVELLTPWGLDNISIPLAAFAVLALLMAMPGAWIVRLAWALGLNILFASAAYLKGAITAAGAVAGATVGLLIFLSGGGFYWSVLMAFFISSSALSRLTFTGPGTGARRMRAARSQAEEIHEKGARRDAVQVLANGGLAALTAVGHGITGSPFFMFGFAIALAAANADTWASEIGVLSRREPRSIITLRRIPRGTSGGVSPLGLTAATGGALFIAVWFAAGYVATHGWNLGELMPMVAAITAGGFLGSLIDSILGASVQAQYWDRIKGGYTEKRIDAGGATNRLVRGFRGMTNDAVNAVSGFASMALLLILVA